MPNPPRARRRNLWFKLCSHLSRTLKPGLRLSYLKNLVTQLSCTLNHRITGPRCLPSRLIRTHGIPNSTWCNSSNTLSSMFRDRWLNNNRHLLSRRVLLKSHPCILHTVPRSLPMLTLSQFQEVWLCSLHTLRRSRSIMKLLIHFMAKATQFCFQWLIIISSSSSHSHCSHTARAPVLNQASPAIVVLHLMLFKEMGRPIAPRTRTLLTALQLLLLFCLSLKLLLRWRFITWDRKPCTIISLEIWLKQPV